LKDVAVAMLAAQAVLEAEDLVAVGVVTLVVQAVVVVGIRVEADQAVVAAVAAVVEAVAGVDAKRDFIKILIEKINLISV
jgi:hypothetical protein